MAGELKRAFLKKYSGAINNGLIFEFPTCVDQSIFPNGGKPKNPSTKKINNNKVMIIFFLFGIKK